VRFVLLPGLGVDARLFDPQRVLPVPFDVPPWPKVDSHDTLENYAERFAADVGPCDAIGGVSFGGMMAQAMAAKVGARVVIGIATARHGRHIPGTIRFAQALSALVKGEYLELFGAIPDRFRPQVMDLVRGARLDVVREGSRMLVTWKGAAPSCPVRLIHGDRDVLIRASLVKPDKVIKGGGHLINMTHPKAVNQFIVDCLKEAGISAAQSS
jgi:pimeloyl-ACP methyl ester carboxylesterase